MHSVDLSVKDAVREIVALHTVKLSSPRYNSQYMYILILIVILGFPTFRKIITEFLQRIITKFKIILKVNSLRKIK